MASVVHVGHLRSYCRLCLLLSFSHAIGLQASRDVNKRELAATTRDHGIPGVPAVVPLDSTRNAAQRSTATSDDDGAVKAAVNLTSYASPLTSSYAVMSSSVTSSSVRKLSQ